MFLVYLEDSGHKLEYGDHSLQLYGAPWTAMYGSGWKAFQVSRETLADKWKALPTNTDILVTHMPPYGVRDMNAGDSKSGLKVKVIELSKILLTLK